MNHYFIQVLFSFLLICSTTEFFWYKQYDSDLIAASDEVEESELKEKNASERSKIHGFEVAYGELPNWYKFHSLQALIDTWYQEQSHKRWVSPPPDLILRYHRLKIYC